jgi:hypothetical protein
VGFVSACPPFSHGIVALSGWPLNALRHDDNYKKGEYDSRQKVALKNRVFFGKTGPRREGRFPIPRKARKTPLCILGKKSPYREKHRENDAFREVLAATRQAEKAKTERRTVDISEKLFHWRESEIRETPHLW